MNDEEKQQLERGAALTARLNADCARLMKESGVSEAVLAEVLLAVAIAVMLRALGKAPTAHALQLAADEVEASRQPAAVQ
jgi:hypothetical protein